MALTKRKAFTADDLREGDVAAIVDAHLERPTWIEGFVLACARCRTICVGAKGCACCSTFKKRNPGGDVIYPPYAKGPETEDQHYTVCRVLDVVRSNRL